jgi:hypothetical protein
MTLLSKETGMRKTLSIVALAVLAVGCDEAVPTGPLDDFQGRPVFDDIPNTLDGSVDAVAEVMSLTAGDLVTGLVA